MITVERVNAPTDEVRALVAALDAELTVNYAPDQAHGLTLEAIFSPDVRFFVARLDGKAIGCGGVGLYDSYAEVKRMYAAQAARGTGVARAVLRRLEDTASAEGYTRIALETGIHQHAAIAFYKREGYLECGAFGPYREMPANAIETSLFFVKALRTGDGSIEGPADRPN